MKVDEIAESTLNALAEMPVGCVLLLVAASGFAGCKGWIWSSCAAGGGATNWPPESSKSLRGGICRTSTTVPNVSTNKKCSATEIVKNRERLSRVMNAWKALFCMGKGKTICPLPGGQRIYLARTDVATQEQLARHPGAH